MNRATKDKETLARRNLNKARSMHQPPARHSIRDYFLGILAKIPVLPQNARSNRALVIRPDHLGDALLMRPALQFIKRERPESEIHVICGAWTAELFASFDEVDDVLELDFPGFQRQRAVPTRNPYLLALEDARELRAIGYDSALIMRPDHWWGAMLAFLAGIQERIGYDINNVAPFLTGRLPHKHEHAVLQNLRLAEFWLGAAHDRDIELAFSAQPAAANKVDRLLSDWRIEKTQAIVCIHPGSGMPSKLWQPDKWAEVADQIARLQKATIIFTGTSSEKDLIDDIAGRMEQASFSAAGRLTLSELVALYRRANVVLGPDSGAMHLASAAQTPTVTLFGPADPIEFAPWGNPRRHATVTSTIACQPCRILDWGDDSLEFHPCVRDIDVSQVLAETQRVLGAKSASD